MSANHYNISLFSSTLYLPRYPSQSVCLDYSAKCASLIDVAQQPALFPECNASVPHSAAVKKFPTFSQVVDTVNLPLTPFDTLLPLRSVTITLRSDPNNFTQANDPGYRTICPEGLYVRTCAVTQKSQHVTVSIPFPTHAPNPNMFSSWHISAQLQYTSPCSCPCPCPCKNVSALVLSIEAPVSLF